MTIILYHNVLRVIVVDTIIFKYDNLLSALAIVFI